MAVRFDQFVETLSQSGLMTAGEAQAVLDGFQADKKPKTGEESAKTPEDRYQSMTETLAALETCVAVKTPVPAPVADEPSGDSELTAFLQSLPKESVAARQKAARVAEDTLESNVGEDTASNIRIKELTHRSAAR